MLNKSFFKLAFCCLYLVNFINAQDSIPHYESIDTRYLEDQFYAGLSYNVLLNKPNEDVVQRNLSYGIQLGFIKDIPLNVKRNFGIGIGLGYGTNSYYNNIIAENTSPISYRFPIQSDSIRRTKFETHAIEFPFELRWRTSDAVDYKFWRIYGGIKAAYLFSRKSKFLSENKANNLSFSNQDISQWQYGLTLNFGYNTWNVHLYYSLNPLLENNASLNGELIEIRPLRVGIIFYIL